MQVQINSLAALERLLGGDSEFEVTIRNNVAQNFAKQKLKIITEAEIQRLSHEIHQSVCEVIMQKIGSFKSVNYSQKFILNSDIQEIIAFHASSIVRSELTKSNERLMQQVKSSEEYYKRYIDEQIKRSIDINIAKLVKEGVDAQIAEIRNKI